MSTIVDDERMPVEAKLIAEASQAYLRKGVGGRKAGEPLRDLVQQFLKGGREDFITLVTKSLEESETAQDREDAVTQALQDIFGGRRV